MPSPTQVRKHGGIKKVRTKRLTGGRFLRIYFFRDGTTYAEVRQRRNG